MIRCADPEREQLKDTHKLHKMSNGDFDRD